MTNVPYQLNANMPKNIMFQSTAVQKFPTSEERQEIYVCMYIYIYNIYLIEPLYLIDHIVRNQTDHYRKLLNILVTPCYLYVMNSNMTFHFIHRKGIVEELPS